ncbi:MAG TPA: NAD(P)-dependent oxidoreductase [Verrucomicrobiae bacterium]|nr:NAD(P)-dependent oxidoreductase [Verrucomicrobiae bacterium]
MKLLVCGSEGRILSKVIPHLLDAGHEVTGVDNCQKWGQRGGLRRYRFVVGDCADPRVLRPLMPGIEGVIQGVATLYGVVGFHERAADILTNDVNAHQNILRLASENRVSRVVFLSSSMVYEQSPHEPHREDDTESAGIPRTDYGLSKLVNERISQTYFQHRGLPYTIWRPFNVIDPGEEAAESAGHSHVFADILDRLVARGQNPLDVLGDGLQVRSFLHVAEAAEAIARFSFDPRTRNQTYNLGRDECVTIRELAARIYRKAVGRGLVPDSGPLQFRSRPVVETDVKRRVGNFEKVAREVGWKSGISLDSSLDDCLDALASRLTVNSEAL